ncbi:MAG: hypothetical protein M3162_07385 [Thermoproteota archaeon]|nr:hypothetical protein [Thermoproteota archaeon]
MWRRVAMDLSKVSKSGRTPPHTLRHQEDGGFNIIKEQTINWMEFRRYHYVTNNQIKK